MNRRSFIAWLAALPIVGRVMPKQEPVCWARKARLIRSDDQGMVFEQYGEPFPMYLVAEIGPKINIKIHCGSECSNG